MPKGRFIDLSSPWVSKIYLTGEMCDMDSDGFIDTCEKRIVDLGACVQFKEINVVHNLFDILGLAFSPNFNPT